jgi:hypothetical protein
MSVRSLTNEKAQQNISITLNVEQILIYQLKWLCLIRHLSFYAPASPPDVGRTGGHSPNFFIYVPAGQSPASHQAAKPQRGAADDTWVRIALGQPVC